MAKKNNEDKGMKRRLKDQLKVYKKAVNRINRTLKEIDFYPVHDKRIETKEYQAVHKKLAIEQDRPCLICGVRNSTLKDKTQNIYQAKQMETHHHIIEWSLANAIDTDKFNKRLLPSLQRRHPKREDYKKPFTEEQIRNWVDHDEDNLWVLCDVHHRAQYFGIHEITDPIWGPVDLLRDDFEKFARDAIEQEKSKAKKQKKSKKK